MPNFVLGLFLLGCLGGAVPDLLRIIKNRYKANLPKYLRSANFWIGLVILIGIGGLTAWILEATTAKDALLYGYAAPQILSSLAGSFIGTHTDRGAPDPSKPPSLPQWWAT